MCCRYKVVSRLYTREPPLYNIYNKFFVHNRQNERLNLYIMPIVFSLKKRYNKYIEDFTRKGLSSTQEEN